MKKFVFILLFTTIIRLVQAQIQFNFKDTVGIKTDSITGLEEYWLGDCWALKNFETEDRTLILEKVTINVRTDGSLVNYDGVALFVFERNGSLTVKRKISCHSCGNLIQLNYELKRNRIITRPVDEKMIEDKYSIISYDKKKMILKRKI